MSKEQPRYPLSEHEREWVTSQTGRPLDELTLERIRGGELGPQDFTIHPETLRVHAHIAEGAGFAQLGANLRRAAELALVPQAKVLAIYEALRPYRLSYEQILALAQEVERDYGAVENGRFIREAAEVYKTRGLV